MKLRINLYPPECYPKRQYLNLVQMVMILSGSLLLLLGINLRGNICIYGVQNRFTV